MNGDRLKVARDVPLLRPKMARVGEEILKILKHLTLERDYI